MNYEIWDKKSDVILPNGKVMSADEFQTDKNYGFSKFATTVLGKCGDITYSVDNLEILKSRYNITETDPQVALTAVLSAKEAEREAAENIASEPSAEERIAAALEYQNLLNM